MTIWNESPPSVFLSYSRADQGQADRLYETLSQAGLHVFQDHRSLRLGAPVWLEINDAISAADYFVLLWSASAAESQGVGVEWNAALSRELRERFIFFYLLRIDATQPPLLLEARQYLDVFSDWDASMRQLLTEWGSDAASDDPRVPGPGPQPASTDDVTLIVKNDFLDVEHVVRVPRDCSGEVLYDRMRSALTLPESTVFGTLSIDFAYTLNITGHEVLPTEAAVPDLANGTMVRLIVMHRERIGSDVTERTYLGPADSDAVETAVVGAFQHLVPPRFTRS